MEELGVGLGLGAPRVIPVYFTDCIFAVICEQFGIAFGILVWSVATVCTGLVHSLPMMFVARAFVGVGEASFVTLAPTIINDVVAPEKKGRSLAIFFLAVPLGGALWRDGARTFVNQGTNGRWRDVLTAEDSRAYEARALAELGEEAAHWLATGQRRGV